MKKLIKQGYNKLDYISHGNMFLLGNGRYGYRGTLEEYPSSMMVNLNVIGFYDRYLDKWREPINLPNPFYLSIKDNNVLEDNPINHYVSLDIENALWNRHSEFKDVIIDSIRFVSNDDKDLLVEKIVITPKKDSVHLIFGTEKNISDINGPHFVNKLFSYIDNNISFNGITNENKKISTLTTYECSVPLTKEENDQFILFSCDIENKTEIYIYCRINQEGNYINIKNFNYELELNNHKLAFNKRWELSNVDIVGDDEADFEIKYSIYHLLILQDECSFKSIPARGLSGQTYKGAIFWDTEMFIIPFLLLTNPIMAKNCLIYRINTLEGAKKKAKEFGYKGAFYAWESQDDGTEQCTKYNVTDPITNKPIRTYFNEKQIHITGDIPLAIDKYIQYTNDYSILDLGGDKVILECARFFVSYATKLNDGLYHLLDVIGPDEYHERIDDNAFTNYVAYLTCLLAMKYCKNVDQEIIDFKNNIYLPKPNEHKIIEQFKGYFALEDVGPNIVKSRVKSKNEYLGGKLGPAYKTKTIKQADVITLLAIKPELFDKETLTNNYNYYLPYTEHGSSLSASMYSLVGSWINDLDTAYQMFRKSSGIDLGTEQKMYAGGIYIGGTHPASNAGAYLSLIYGFAGLNIKDDKISLNPHLPSKIQELKFKIIFRNEIYSITINHNDYMIKNEGRTK